MYPKVGHACGTCPVCGKEHCRPRPQEYVYCDCWKFCPDDHGTGPYTTPMKDFTPDASMGAAYDTEKGILVVKYCDHADHSEGYYYSKQLPVEVELE